MKPEKLRELIIENLEEFKAQDIVALNVTDLTDITDFMIICSGTSSRHVHSIAKNLITKIKQHQIRPLGLEQEANGEWTLVDFADVVVHIMLPAPRELYDLEKLWGVNLAEKQRGQSKNDATK